MSGLEVHLQVQGSIPAWEFCFLHTGRESLGETNITFYMALFLVGTMQGPYLHGFFFLGHILSHSILSHKVIPTEV